MSGTARHRLVLGIVLSLAGTHAGARELSEIRAEGKLRICVAGSSAAFYQRNGEAFARFLGVRPEITLLASYDTQFHNASGFTVRAEAYVPRLLADGSCDIYPNDLHVVGWRESKMRLVPYYDVRNVAVVRGSLLNEVKQIQDLAGRTAAVQEGTAYDDWLRQANQAELSRRPVMVTYAPTVESLRLVAEGKADFTIIGTEGALRWVRDEGHRLAIAFPVSEAEKVGWGLHPAANDLAAQVRRFFEANDQPGSALDLNWREYYHFSFREYQVLEASFAAGRVDLKRVLFWATPSAIGALLILASVLFWNRRLKREVRERQAAEAALRAAHAELDAIFESTSSAIALVRGLRIERCNHRLEKVFGYGPGEVIGRPAQALFQISDAEHDETITRVRATLARGETYRREKLLARKDGGMFWCRYSGHAVVAGDTAKGSVWLLEDITEEHAAADALREAKRVAEEATRAKSMFLASMSHEIRTPMNGVLGMLQLVGFTRLDPEQRATLDTARDSAKALLRIIDDLLDFSKIEAGRLELRVEPTAIGPLVESVQRVYSGVASAKDLTLAARLDPRIAPAHSVDALRLRQILNNFASNAIKFTEKGRVEIAVESVGRADGREILRFSVTDTGIGVSAEAQARLFQPYAQAAADTARRFGGTGLGLTICRRLADLMGGEIAMQSEPARGTTITLVVSLPLADPRDVPASTNDSERAMAALVAMRRRAPVREEARDQGSLVLIAEDHPTNRAVLTRHLDLLGYAAESAENGREALEKWRSGRFAALITDCHMPEMDGYALARAIRAAEAPGGRRMPIVACTANALPGELEQCAAAGMDDMVAKPVELEALAAVMGRWLPLPAASQDDAPLDRGALAQVTGGDKEMERGILLDFRAAYACDLTALRSALAERDLPGVVGGAHRIKGACRTVGAGPLAEICARIEDGGRRGDWQAVSAETAAFERESGRLGDWLANLQAVE